MAGCSTSPTPATKACSGKCMGGGACSKSPRVWVVAACDGMVSLFEKRIDGHMSPLPQTGSGIFSSIEAFQHVLQTADEKQMLDQLIIVGGRSDIAWMHASLPAPIAKHIAAEIEYPLMSGWFKQPPNLAHALEHVFGH